MLIASSSLNDLSKALTHKLQFRAVTFISRFDLFKFLATSCHNAEAFRMGTEYGLMDSVSPNRARLKGISFLNKNRDMTSKMKF